MLKQRLNRRPICRVIKRRAGARRVGVRVKEMRDEGNVPLSDFPFSSCF